MMIWVVLGTTSTLPSLIRSWPVVIERFRLGRGGGHRNLLGGRSGKKPLGVKRFDSLSFEKKFEVVDHFFYRYIFASRVRILCMDLCTDAFMVRGAILSSS